MYELRTLPAIRRCGQSIAWLIRVAPAADGSLVHSRIDQYPKVDPREHVTSIAENIVGPYCKTMPGVEPKN
jgi:hypothetical protein